MTTMTTPPPTVRALRFVEPLPGFDGEDAYTLSEIDPDGVLLAMRSVQDPSLRFVLTPAEVFFPGYRPALADTVARALGKADEEALQVLLVLTIGDGLGDATANLRAPIVVAEGTGAATQVVLDDESLPMYQPLLRN